MIVVDAQILRMRNRWTAICRCLLCCHDDWLGASDRCSVVGSRETSATHVAEQGKPKLLNVGSEGRV